MACVIAHCLAALPLVLTVSIPLIVVPLGAPILLAILAPVSLIATLVLVANVERTTRAPPDEDAPTSTCSVPLVRLDDGTGKRSCLVRR